MTITQKFRSLSALTALAAGLVFPATSYAADPVLNGQPNDYPTLQVAKHGGQWGTSVSAAPGDALSLLVWDHNSVPDTTAHNVRIKVNLPSSSEFRNQHTVTASVSADNAATATGSVAISTAELTKLSYIANTAKLYANTGGENPQLTEINWPAGVNLADLFTTGVNLGDQKGCWQYAKAVILQVKLTGQDKPEPKGVIKISKDNRRVGEHNYSDRTTVNPGDRVEYRIVGENIDNTGIARNIRLQDVLPAGVTYVAGSGKLTKPNGETISISDGVTNGMVVLDELRPGQKFTFTFLADTAKSFKDAQCAKNTATITADNTTNGTATDTTDTCFVEKPKPTPTPTPTPTPPAPTPQPTLPDTGPEASLLAATLFSGMGLSTARYAVQKRKLKRASRSLDIR